MLLSVLLAAGLSAGAEFSTAEAEVGFGKTLEDFGVADVKSVHAKDFGFNPSNATAAIQRAIDSGRRVSSFAPRRAPTAV